MRNKLKITIFSTLSSGSNTYYLYKSAPRDIREKYEIRMLTLDQAKTDSTIHDSDVYITTHGEYPSSAEKINIELWHGFPLKGMANMDHEETASTQAIHNHWSKLDLIMSYSPLYNTLLNSCMGARIHQYRITGMPRNDALFHPDSTKKLQALLPGIEGRKTAFFLPTFRKSVVAPKKTEGNKKAGNVFGFEFLDVAKFRQFLSQENLALIIKLHPFEERFYLDRMNEWRKQGVFFLTNRMLREAELDFYDILGAGDMLLTDYSSVYFDFLLLNRPIVFLPVDLASYASTRGFLLEPYELWTPGPKALCQRELEEAMKRSLDEPEWYASERETIARMVHTYRDNRAASRVWHEIDQYIDSLQARKAEEKQRQSELALLQQGVKNQIRSWIETGRWPEALTAIEDYLKSAAADEELISMKGIAQLFGGQQVESVQTLTAGHRLFPGNSDICYNLAYAYESLEQFASAIHYYETAKRLTHEIEVIHEIEDRLHAISLAKE